MRNTAKGKQPPNKLKSKSPAAKAAPKKAASTKKKKVSPKEVIRALEDARIEEGITIFQLIKDLEEKLTTFGKDLANVADHLNGFDGPIERLDAAIGDVEFTNGPEDPLYLRVKRVEAILEAIATQLGIAVPAPIIEPEVDGGDLEPDGEEPDGEEPDGEEPDGEEPDGEEPDGADQEPEEADVDVAATAGDPS